MGSADPLPPDTHVPPLRTKRKTQAEPSLRRGDSSFGSIDSSNSRGTSSAGGSEARKARRLLVLLGRSSRHPASPTHSSESSPSQAADGSVRGEDPPVEVSDESSSCDDGSGRFPSLQPVEEDESEVELWGFMSFGYFLHHLGTGGTSACCEACASRGCAQCQCPLTMRAEDICALHEDEPWEAMMCLVGGSETTACC